MTQSRDFHIVIVTAHVIRHLPEQASAVSDKVTFILLIHCVFSCYFKLSIVVLKLKCLHVKVKLVMISCKPCNHR